MTERDDLPCRYGLVEPLRSNNPIIIIFHEWIALVRDLWQARSWRDRWSYLVGPPGWQPDQERPSPSIVFDIEAPELLVERLCQEERQLRDERTDQSS